MAVNITTYTGLQSAVLAWMAREGDTDLTNRFDDFLALCESRLYFGRDAMPALGIPMHEPIRLPQMETVDTAFALTASVAQPTGFLELVEATLNSPLSPMDIVEQSVIDSYGSATLDTPKLIAVSGTNFRVFPDPGTGSYTATLRYYAKLTTPTASTANWLLSNAPNVYLNGCLLEAAIFTGDADAAKMYATLYASDVSGLNNNRNRQLAAAQNVKIRLRGRQP